MGNNDDNRTIVCSRKGCTNSTNLMKYAKSVMADGSTRHYYMCTFHNAERRRKYYKTPAGKAKILGVIKRYGSDNPERRKAWTAAQQIPLEPCEVCGATKNVHRHHDDPKKQLEVMFLCALHHRRRHIEMEQLQEAAA